MVVVMSGGGGRCAGALPEFVSAIYDDNESQLVAGEAFCDAVRLTHTHTLAPTPTLAPTLTLAPTPTPAPTPTLTLTLTDSVAGCCVVG